MDAQKKVYWTRAAHCMRCHRGFTGEGAKEKAEACFDLGLPNFEFKVGDVVVFKGKTYRWIITAAFVRNSVALAGGAGNVVPSHVKCYSIKGFDHHWLKKECVTEGALRKV